MVCLHSIFTSIIDVKFFEGRDFLSSLLYSQNLEQSLKYVEAY